MSGNKRRRIETNGKYKSIRITNETNNDTNINLLTDDSDDQSAVSISSSQSESKYIFMYHISV